MSVTVLPDLPPPSSPLVSPPAVPPLPVWCVTVSYDEDSGVRQAPLCGPDGAQNKFVRVHGGKCVKIIRWAAIGWGAKPPLPHWDTLCPNEILLRRVRHMPVPGKAADGADIITYSGEYYYGLQVPIDDTDILTGAAAPYQSSPNVNVYQLTEADFFRTFTGPSIPPFTTETLTAFEPDI